MAAVLIFGALLTACTPDFASSSSSVMMVAHSDGPATVDPAAAAAMISEFRRANGLAPVTVDPTLNAIAATHAKRMASSDKLAHVLFGEGSFGQRLMAGGYDAATAVENIGAGYHNLDQAFAGWRQSPHHRVNMLNPSVTRLGIAIAYTSNGKFHDFWSLVMAQPDNRAATDPVMAVPQ